MAGAAIWNTPIATSIASAGFLAATVPTLRSPWRTEKAGLSRATTEAECQPRHSNWFAPLPLCPRYSPTGIGKSATACDLRPTACDLRPNEVVVESAELERAVHHARLFRIFFVRARAKSRSLRARCDRRSRADSSFARQRGPVSQAVCHAAAKSTGRFVARASMRVSA